VNAYGCDQDGGNQGDGNGREVVHDIDLDGGVLLVVLVANELEEVVVQLLALCSGLSLADLREGDLGHGGASSDEVSQELSVCARHDGDSYVFSGSGGEVNCKECTQKREQECGGGGGVEVKEESLPGVA
jgi:hypothetical protein